MLLLSNHNDYFNNILHDILACFVLLMPGLLSYLEHCFYLRVPTA